MKNFAKKIKAKSFALSSTFFIGLLNFPINKVEAACPPGQYAKNGTTCTATNAGSAPENVVKNSLAADFSSIFNSVAIILLSITIITIITSGYMYMTSSGQPEKVQRAKKLFTGSGFAIIVLASAYTIYRFFGGLMTGGGAL